MILTKSQLDQIYRRTSGYCHLCHSKLSRKNYATAGKKGAWEVEHSVPRSKGGSNHPNNLFAACISCNRDKGIMTTRTARGWNGKQRAPLSPSKRKAAKIENGMLGAACGGLLGLAIAGPVGAAVGALALGQITGSANPD